LNDPLRRPRLSATWTTFSYLAVYAYILYGLGTATPYLRNDLRLTGFESGLHASAMAVGVLIAGFTADGVAHRIGSRWLLDLAVSSLIVGVVLIAAAPGLPISLAGALLLGSGGGALGTHVNVQLGSSGEAQSRKLLGQANALAMITAASAPIAIGLAASFHFWRIALLLPIVGFVALAAIRPSEEEAPALVRGPKTALPGSYWFVWVFLIVAVSIEFSFVFWGSTVVSRTTGISNADATLLASLFVVGMFTGRAAIGNGIGAGRGIRGLMALGLAIILFGTGLICVSASVIVSGLGLFLGGLGTSGLWPLGITIAMQGAPKAQMQAAARAALASGVAALVAPSGLGLLSDEVGVVSAWPIILILAAAGLMILAVTPSSTAAMPGDLPPSA
jgi:MFS family permease